MKKLTIVRAGGPFWYEPEIFGDLVIEQTVADAA